MKAEQPRLPAEAVLGHLPTAARVRVARPGHPDATLIARVRDALAWWASQLPSTPSSSITGGGAINAVERAVSELILGRPALALPNATYGLRTALLAVGVRAGDDVLVSGVDWPSGRAAVRSVGARPIPLQIDPRTLTADPASAAMVRTSATTALLTTHLHGVCVDVPAFRAVLGNELPIIEDAAQALTATIDKQPAGSLADAAVFSFGPNKVIDAGEFAVLTTRDETLLDRAIRMSQHPVRQLLRGSGHPPQENLSGRPCPLAAVLAAYQLHHWPVRANQLQLADRQLHMLLDAHAPHLARLTHTARRTGQPGTTTVLLPDTRMAELANARLDLPDRLPDDRPITVATSGATTCPGLSSNQAREARSLTSRIRLLVLGEPGASGSAATSSRRHR